MQPKFTSPSNLRIKITRLRSARFAVTAVLAASLAAACGETDEPTTDWNSPIGAGNTGGTGGTSGVGGTTGGSVLPPGTGGGGSFAGIGGASGGSPSGGQGPIVGPSNNGGTAGGGGTTGGAAGADTPYCKVKAIIDANCLSCHGATLAAGAPFKLVTYADLTAPHPTRAGKKVYERVGVRIHADQSQAESLVVMPPGKPLPAADIATIDQWVAAGAPEGANPTCAGVSGPITGGEGGGQAKVWPLPECDAVYKVTAHGAGGVDSPAMAPPGVESHPQVGWDAPWGNEEVQAIAFKTITDNSKVLHHWILSGRPGGFLTGWAPGEDGVRLMKPDVGMLMPRGPGSLNLDMHYYNTMGTQAEPDKSGVEICVVKKAKFRKNNAAITMSLMNIGDFLGGGLAPANTTNHEVTSNCTLGGSQPITLLSASPHAHKYARHMRFTLTRANGEKVVMHDMPFMFGEQKSYGLDPPVVAMPGDTITTTCIYTNTTSRNITFGESTENEMCFNFAMYYPAGALTCSGGGGLIGGFGGGGNAGAGGALGGLLGF